MNGNSEHQHATQDNKIADFIYPLETDYMCETGIQKVTNT